MIELFKFFLILGATGFGGPLSLVQLMREHFVDKKKLVEQSDFDQVFTMIKAMPGPVAFQMAVHLGHRFYKLPGAFLAGFGILFPAFVIIIFFGLFYESLEKFKYFKYLLDGFLFSVSAIILISLKSMVLSAYKNYLFWLVMFISISLAWFQFVPEPLLIIGSGFLVLILESQFYRTKNSFLSVGFLFIDSEKLVPLFKVCLYAGAFVFGTGLAILPVLKNFFVDQLHWLTLQEFNDGVIFGQMTPGPVTITASFLGYRVSGFAGALVATLGIFMMPFIHMVTWFPRAVKWLSAQKWIKVFLIGATAAVVGTILVTVFRMNENFYSSFMFWILFSATTIVLLIKPKISLLLLIFLSGLINLLVAFATMHSV